MFQRDRPRHGFDLYAFGLHPESGSGAVMQVSCVTDRFGNHQVAGFVDGRCHGDTTTTFGAPPQVQRRGATMTVSSTGRAMAPLACPLATTTPVTGTILGTLLAVHFGFSAAVLFACLAPIRSPARSGPRKGPATQAEVVQQRQKVLRLAQPVQGKAGVDVGIAAGYAETGGGHRRAPRLQVGTMHVIMPQPGLPGRRSECESVLLPA